MIDSEAKKNDINDECEQDNHNKVLYCIDDEQGKIIDTNLCTVY